ncbi:MAG: 1-acyl-sn-glycerol-3-phosphate acyltransferase, partial [Bacteroidales bacterium]|nr:1-acyl-sn-glycerol-3-phosphate acyltransferase [Bacteroidales bacterium]
LNTILLFVCNARVVFKTVRAMLKFMFKIMFVKVEVEYPEGFDFNQSYIIMPNHITFWDIPVICSELPNYTFGIEAESHFSWPIYGFFIKKYGTLPINRKNILASFRTFETAAQNMKAKNASLLVFPEGHRSDDGKIQEFKKIPFKMAQIVKVPILPCGTSGLGKLAPKGFFITPCKVKIKYGTPVPVADYESLRPEVAAKMVRQMVIELSEDDIVPENEKQAIQ